MSTPLFIREPQVACATSLGSPTGMAEPLNGQSFPEGGFWTALFRDVAEPTLIEEIRYSSATTSGEACELVIALVDETAYGGAGIVYPTNVFQIPSGSSTTHTSGVIALDLVIPVGWTLCFAHNLEASSEPANLIVVAVGGIVR